MTSRDDKDKSAPQRIVESSRASVSPHRERILEAALGLLTAGGRDAVATRAVAKAAGVQPTVLYRLFRDKRDLLDAVTEYGFALYLSEKRQPLPAEDSIQFLREGWARHIQFGLAHPELYLLMYADPQPTETGRSHPHGRPGLTAHMESIAAEGRLRLPAGLAADLFYGAACGVVMTLLATSAKERNVALSQVACEAALFSILCEAALSSILTDRPIAPHSTAATAANMLRAQLLLADAQQLPTPRLFSEAETSLMLEWLGRLVAQSFCIAL